MYEAGLVLTCSDERQCAVMHDNVQWWKAVFAVTNYEALKK